MLFVSTVFSGTVKHVLLGGYDVANKNHATIINITEIILHTEFTRTKKYNDIALIRLDRAIKFDQYIQPACLPSTHSDAIDNRASVSGWNDYQSEDATFLTKYVDLFTKEECANAYQNSTRMAFLNEGIKDEQQLCAGPRGEHKDSCVVRLRVWLE